MIFSKNKQRKHEVSAGDVAIALDIGTEFIKTAVFRVEEDNTASVLGVDRSPQDPAAMRGALIINLESVLDVVDLSIGNAVDQASTNSDSKIGVPNKIIIGIAGELVQGVPIVVNVERELPDVKITKQEVDNIINQIRKETFEEAKEDIAYDTGVKTSHIQEISTVIDSLKIDGVGVTNPIGFRGQDLEYKVFSTFAPKIHISSVQSVPDSLGLKLAKIFVEPYSIARSLPNSLKESFSGIFVDIGGGTTDVAVVTNGAITGVKMFAYGGRVFTKRLMKEFDLDKNQAEKLKHDYSDQKLSSQEELNVKKALAADVSLWLNGLEIALAEIADVEVYPSDIYLCGGGALLPDIQSGILAHPWLSRLSFHKFPSPKFLFPNQIKSINDKTRSLTRVDDYAVVSLINSYLYEK